LGLTFHLPPRGVPQIEVSFESLIANAYLEVFLRKTKATGKEAFLLSLILSSV